MSTLFIATYNLVCEVLYTFHMAENKESMNDSDIRPLSDDTSSNDEPLPEDLKITEEEKRGTIPGSTQAMAMTLACTLQTTVNPTVKRGKAIKRNKKKNKKPKDKETQTTEQKE